MSETVFLVNPASGGGSTARRWPEIAHQAASAGLFGDAFFSDHPGHLSELAAAAVKAHARRIVLVGGDGSLNEVVNGLAKHADKVELALIPRGTGSDFVRAHGIPRSVSEAVQVALEGDVRAVDLGRAVFHAWDGSKKTQYFANSAGAGISGAIARRVNEGRKALGARGSYAAAVVAVFARWRNCNVRVRVNEQEREGKMHEVLAAIGRYQAGGMKLCPDAIPDDGLFDVLILGDLSKADLAANLHKTYRGTHLSHPKVELLRGTSVSIEAAEPLPIQLDGEQPGTTPVLFELIPGALRLRVPARDR
ncbi:MAG: diacylglycerol kinase family protein [Gaiellaceae bacterium]|jgi:YegS/Rv2252/BmrU family lipid kinase